MTCYYPLIRIEYGPIQPNGKRLSKILSNDNYEYIQKKINEQNNYFAKLLISEDERKNYINNFQLIPCGKCIGCRLDMSKEWATRCALETKLWDYNWFVTLTYNEENKPYTNIKADGSKIYIDQARTWNGYLKPEDMTKFMKDLRAYYKYHYDHDNIRFFGAGEYGEKTARPHYHLIIFNLPIEPEDLIFYKHDNKNHVNYYICTTLEKIWGKGNVILGEVTWSSCAYVARYVCKKWYGPTKDSHYAKLGQTPEFSRMSRRPGIGRSYFEENWEEIYKNDELIMKTAKGNIGSTKIPKYFDKLLEVENPNLHEKIKEKRRKAAEENEILEASKTTNTKKERLLIKERTKKLQAKKLKRDKTENISNTVNGIKMLKSIND